METVQYIQLMTSMRFTLRGAVVTGDAYFGRFRKSWYIYRLQLLTVVLTQLKESLSTLIVCVCVYCRGWTTFLSILQAVALRLPGPYCTMAPLSVYYIHLQPPARPDQ